MVVALAAVGATTIWIASRRHRGAATIDDTVRSTDAAVVAIEPPDAAIVAPPSTDAAIATVDPPVDAAQRRAIRDAAIASADPPLDTADLPIDVPAPPPPDAGRGSRPVRSVLDDPILIPIRQEGVPFQAQMKRLSGEIPRIPVYAGIRTYSQPDGTVFGIEFVSPKIDKLDVAVVAEVVAKVRRWKIETYVENGRERPVCTAFGISADPELRRQRLTQPR